MRKLLFFALLFLFAGKFSNAQVTESKIMVDSLNRPALYMETDIPEGDVKDAIKDYFDSLHVDIEKGTGFIIKKQLPFMEFKRVVADSMEGQALDYYFKVDTKKQKGPDATTICVAASKGYNNFISLQSDTRTWNDFKNFAVYLQSNYFEQYKTRQNILSLTKDLNKQNSRLKDVEDEKQKLEKDIADKNLQMAALLTSLNKLKGKAL